MSQKILRLAGVLERTGLSKATVYRAINRGDFPRPVQLGLRSVGWREADVQAWLQRRPDAGPEPRPAA